MKTPTIWLGFGLTAVLVSAGVTGCASHSQQGTVSPKTIPQTIPQLGAEMERNGIISQSDYIRQNALAHAVSKSHTISEADFTWILTQLTTQKNSVARARAFNTLAEIRPVSAARKLRILPAAAPFLTGGDRLDQLGALRVQKSVQAN